MFSDPQFWIAIAFIIFVIAIFNPVRKMLSSSLDEKIENIKKSIEEAENIKNESQIALSNVKKRQSEIKSEIDEMKEDAKKKLGTLESQARLKLEDQIKKRDLLAKSKIDQMTRDANDLIKLNISQIAIESAQELIEKKLDKDQKQIVLDNAVKELEGALKN